MENSTVQIHQDQDDRAYEELVAIMDEAAMRTRRMIDAGHPNDAINLIVDLINDMSTIAQEAKRLILIQETKSNVKTIEWSKLSHSTEWIPSF